MNTTVLAGTAAVVAVAGVIALVMRTDDEQPRQASQSQPAPNGGTPTTATTAPNAATPTSTPSAANATRWQRPARGRYRFHASRTGSSPNEHDATLDVAHGKGGAYTELRDHGAFRVRRSLTQTPQGLTETGFAIESNADPIRCTWSTPVLVIPAKPADGEAFEAKATCTTEAGSTKAVIEHTSTSTVVGMRSAQTPAGTTPLLRIDRQVTTRTITGNRVAERRSEIVQYYDTARGLLAQSTEEATETGPSGDSTFRIVETMLTLQPEDP